MLDVLCSRCCRPGCTDGAGSRASVYIGHFGACGCFPPSWHCHGRSGGRPYSDLGLCGSPSRCHASSAIGGPRLRAREKNCRNGPLRPRREAIQRSHWRHCRVSQPGSQEEKVSEFSAGTLYPFPPGRQRPRFGEPGPDWDTSSGQAHSKAPQLFRCRPKRGPSSPEIAPELVDAGSKLAAIGITRLASGRCSAQFSSIQHLVWHRRDQPRGDGQRVWFGARRIRPHSGHLQRLRPNLPLVGQCMAILTDAARRVVF